MFLKLQFHTVAIIAEGIPERVTQLLNKKAKEKGVNIIGPATVSSLFQIFDKGFAPALFSTVPCKQNPLFSAIRESGFLIVEERNVTGNLMFQKRKILRITRKKIWIFFPVWSFIHVLQVKCFSNCSSFDKADLK